MYSFEPNMSMNLFALYRIICRAIEIISEDMSVSFS